MRFIIPAAIVGITLTAAARADTPPDYSAMIRDMGLADTATALSQITTPTPSDNFALGGVYFLRTVEMALQTQYRVGVDPELAQMSGLPFLRLGVGGNPNPTGFYPDVIEEVFAAALPNLDRALTHLDQISDADDVGVTINTSDLWFDINMNGTQDIGENLFAVLTGDINPAFRDDFTAPTIRFDTSDAAWLSAYAHLLSGVSETVLAIGPTDAIQRVTTSTADLAALQGGFRNDYFMPGEQMWVDMAAMVLHALDGPVDVDHSRAAHAHFLGMIEDNKTFWDRVSCETDNTAEWIPNKSQTSALPIPFAPETGDMWRAVLAEAEMVLTGDLVLGHWRLPDGLGIDVAAFMQNPPSLDVVAMIQGESILPYVKQAPRMEGQAWRQFRRMMGGDAVFYAVIYN